VTCPSYTSVFQDTCSYDCNCGYQLEARVTDKQDIVLMEHGVVSQ